MQSCEDDDERKQMNRELEAKPEPPDPNAPPAEVLPPGAPSWYRGEADESASAKIAMAQVSRANPRPS